MTVLEKSRYHRGDGQYPDETVNAHGTWKLLDVDESGTANYGLVEPTAAYLKHVEKRQQREEKKEIEQAIAREMNAILRRQAIENLKNRGELPQDFKD